MYSEINYEQFNIVKKQLDRTKFHLLKFNISLPKLEEARKMIDKDFKNVQQES